MNSISFIDTSFCDAQQTQWAGALKGEQILPILGRTDRIGMQSIDIMGPELFESMVTNLREDPWLRMSAAASRCQNTPLNVWISGRYLFGQRLLESSDVIDGVGCIAECGIKRIYIFDALNDLTNVEDIITEARRLNMEVCGTLVYAASPVLNDAYYSDLAKKFLHAGATSICFWDPAGSLGTEYLADLFSAVRKASGTVPLELKSPCSSGVAELVYLQAIELGVTRLHTAVSTVSSGYAFPATEYFLLHQRRQNETVDLNETELSSVAEYFAAMASVNNFPIGRQLLRNFSAIKHQLPVSEVLLARQIVEDKHIGISLDEILDEVAHIRLELNAPPLAWPIASIIRRQAILNLTESRRYECLDLDFCRLIGGAFSKLSNSVGEQLRKLALDKLKYSTEQAESVAGECSRRSTAEQNITKAELLTASMYGRKISDAVAANFDSVDLLHSVDAETPFDQLVGEISRREWVKSISLSKGDFKFELENVA